MSVARRLGLTYESFAFILSGGIFRAVPWLEQELDAAPAARRARAAVVSLLDREPAEGAVCSRCRRRAAALSVPVYKP